MFSKEPRKQLHKHQLAQVICQLRFPQILIIEERPPAAFQEQIRDQFPQYSRRMETSPPKITGMPGNLAIEKPQATVNHQFSSADGAWQIHLTSTFISLSCSNYSSWESFAKMLDKPLAAFIQIYKPAYFQRIGLRYLNFISRKCLSLEGIPYRDLIHPCYLGPLGCHSIAEHTATRCSVDTELVLAGGCHVKIHAGPGLVKQHQQTHKEVHFIFDQDLFMNGNIPVNYSAGALETLHAQAFSVFRGAITDTLYEAMEPSLT